MISDAVSDDVAEVLTDTEIENHSPTASKLEVRKPATRPRLRADDLRARRHADYRVHQRLSFLFCDYCGETRIVSRFTVFAVIYSEKH